VCCGVIDVQSTDNMEMMTQLQSEQHIAKELTARLGQREDELKDLRDEVSSYGSCQLPWRYLLLFSSASGL